MAGTASAQVDAFGSTDAFGSSRTDQPAAAKEAVPGTAASPETTSPPKAEVKTGSSPTTVAPGEKVLVVIDENGVVKYADPEVYVADLATLLGDSADADALFATLGDLRGVKPSDARKRLVGRVTETMTDRMGL